MKYTASSVALLAGAVSAFPQYAQNAKRQDANPYVAPGAGDVRAPCPGLNTLANHGYINHNGQGISVQQMQQGFLDAFGFAFEVTAAGGANSLSLCQSNFNNGNPCSTFDLDMLNVAHQIEHDASMTRNDLEMSWNLNADNHDFNATVWQETICAFGGASHIDVALSNTARTLRIAEAQAEDAPGWFQENDGGTSAEHGFYLNAMNDFSVAQIGDAAYPQANFAWVDYWFSNERLPTAVGWTKPAQTISNDMVNSVGNAVFAAQTVANTCQNSVPTTTPPPTTSSKPYGNSTTSTVTSPAQTTSVCSVASSSASASASPVPTYPNAYEVIVSSSTWTTIYEQAAAYVESYQSVFYEVIGSYGVQVGPVPSGVPSPSGSGYSSGSGSSSSGSGSGSGYGSGSGSGSGVSTVVVWTTVTSTVEASVCAATSTVYPWSSSTVAPTSTWTSTYNSTSWSTIPWTSSSTWSSSSTWTTPYTSTTSCSTTTWSSSTPTTTATYY